MKSPFHKPFGSRSPFGPQSGVSVPVLTLVEDGLEEATPFYTFSSTASGTLRWDFHSSATPPAAGSGDHLTGTQAISSGTTVFEVDLSAAAGETGYLHLRVSNSAGTSNILTSQQITVPSNAATWGDKGTGITLSNGDLDAVGSVGTWNLVRASGAGKSSGKWYFEILIVSALGGGSLVAPGFADATTAAGAGMSGSTAVPNSGGARCGDSFDFGSGVTYPGSYQIGTSEATNDVLGCHLDLDNRKAYFSKNGVYAGSSDPSAGTNPRISWGTSWTVWPACYIFGSSTTVRLVTTGCTYTPDTGFSEYGS